MSQEDISKSMEQFARKLAYLAELKERGEWSLVERAISADLRVLTGMNPSRIYELSAVEMFATLVERGSTVWVPFKQCMLTALLKEAGDFAAARYSPDGGYWWYLSALHMLLDVFSGSESLALEQVGFLPSLDALLGLIRTPLPLSTRLLLMREFEKQGRFEQAAESWYAAFDEYPQNPSLLGLGICFFDRVLRQADTVLAAHGLSRAKVNATLAQLKSLKSEIADQLELEQPIE